MKKKQRRKLRKKIKKNIASKRGNQNFQAQQQAPQSQTSDQAAFARKLSPELRQQFDLFVSNALNVIHDPQVSQRIIQKLRSASDPVETVAVTVVDIVRRLEAGARNHGVNLNLAVVAQGGNIILNEIVTLEKAAGIPPLSDEQKYQAYSLAVALYINKAVKDGEITPQELQQWAEELKQTKQGQKIWAEVQKAASANPDTTPEQQPAPEAAPSSEQGPSAPVAPNQGTGQPSPGLLQNNGGA